MDSYTDKVLVSADVVGCSEGQHEQCLTFTSMDKFHAYYMSKGCTIHSEPTAHDAAMNEVRSHMSGVLWDSRHYWSQFGFMDNSAFDLNKFTSKLSKNVKLTLKKSDEPDDKESLYPDDHDCIS
jgi:hypothetical protein